MTSIVGKENTARFAIVVLRRALMMYQKTGMKVNRAYTPTAMLAAASQHTGKKFKRGQYQEAIDALTELLGE